VEQDPTIKSYIDVQDLSFWVEILLACWC
jgi:hypothetical protein